MIPVAKEYVNITSMQEARELGHHMEEVRKFNVEWCRVWGLLLFSGQWDLDEDLALFGDDEENRFDF